MIDELSLLELEELDDKLQGIILRKEKEHKEYMIRSGKVGGAVGVQPTKVTKYVLNIWPPTAKVLDFGAGTNLRQVKILQEHGFLPDARDFGEVMRRWPEGVASFGTDHDVVMLSNVINVQATRTSILKTMAKALLKRRWATYLFLSLPL